MTIDSTHKGFNDLLAGAVSPRPIALASTVDANGNVNLSPFSFFNTFSIHPAILVFSPSRRVRDNTTKHTLENILETREVVINTVSYDMVEQVSLASVEFGQGVNEFIKSGLTEVPSQRVRPPRVKESPVSFECRVLDVTSLGTQAGSGNLVICEVLLVHAADHIFNQEGKVDPQKIDHIGRMNGNYYCRIHGESIFEVPKPGTAKAIGFDQLPKNIRNSSVLTGNDLGRLAMVEKIPVVDSVAPVENSDPKVVHRRAQLLIRKGEIEKAWIVLMSHEQEH